MPPRPPPTCQICQTSESKYNCPKCRIPYCSLGCYKTHQEQPVCASTTVATLTGSSKPPPTLEQQDSMVDEEVLRPLTSLKWPYVPEESAYVDPLKRDDPKVVQLSQYETIGESPLLILDNNDWYKPRHLPATSVAVRKALSEHSDLKPLLRSIDSLRGGEREETLQRALGVSQANLQGASSTNKLGICQEDIEAMRRLSSAIDAAIRGDRPSALGLDIDGEQ